MKKYHFICNPASKSGKGIEFWDTVEKYLKDEGIEYDVLFSQKPGHIKNLVETVTSEHLNDVEPVNVILLGGDGTLDEALQGIKDFSKMNLGYIPTGSGNDFSRALPYTGDTIEDLKRILSIDKPMKIDLGKLEYLDYTEDRAPLKEGPIDSIHYFDVSCGIGLDAAICEQALVSKFKNFLNKIGMGSLIYALVAVKLLFVDKKPHVVLKLDGDKEVELKKTRFIAGMNTCFEGGGFKFAPDAVCDDGYLDVCAVSNIPVLEALKVMLSAPSGGHVNNKHVDTYHIKNYEVKSDIPLWVHTDGEVFTKSSHIKVSVEPGILNFLF